MKAGAAVKAFRQLTLNADGEVIETTAATQAGAVTLAMINLIISWQKGIIGRSYGAPGGMRSPAAVANNGTVVVRLGSD